jgi:elongation factor Ts
MAEITVEQVKQLRGRTGAGMMDCKRALEEADGDIEEAIDLLRKRGAATAEKRADKVAEEGVVEAYVHHSRNIGVLVEVNCETDFVARTDDFQELAREIAMQVAATDPIAVSREDVPAEVVERERAVYLGQAKEEGKPDEIAEKIVEGRLRKYFEQRTLMEQAFVKNPEITVADRIAEAQATLGEKIKVRRFTRFEVGE